MSHIYRLLFVITFLLISEKGIAESRNMDWISDFSTKLRKRINLDELSFETEIKSNEWVKIKPLLILPSDLTEIKNKYAYADHFQRSDQVIRFVLHGTGLIYDFDEKSGELKRIDKTIHSGYNFTPHRFFRQGILFSIGGEGFWSYNRRITFFDEKSTKEWEILRAKNEGPEVISDGYQGFSSKEDAFYSGGSLKKNFLENEEITTLKQLFKFDFKTKEWSLLGEINFPTSTNLKRTIYWNGTNFVQLARDRVYFLNPSENTVHVYKDNVTYFEDAGDYYVSNDTILYYNQLNKGPVKIIAVNTLFKKATYVGKFYEEEHSYFIILVAASISLVILLVLLLMKKRTKNQLKLDEVERRLLENLYKSKDQMINTNDLNDLLDCANKSQENQRRIRYVILNQINQKLESHLQIKNAIERTPSEEDKRIFNYHLKRGIEEKIESILSNEKP